MTDHVKREPFPPRWVFLVAALMIIAGLVWNMYMQLSATAEKNTAQANSQTLAQDIQQVCSTQGKLMVDDRDLCAKATQVQENPTEAIPGPKGDPGVDGKNGVDGKDGVASTIPGPPGTSGSNGKDGADGVDSSVPGPRGTSGLAGSDGKDGKDGSTPTSFTFTDKTGTAYTCTPNPPGSSTYTCTTDSSSTPNPVK